MTATLNRDGYFTGFIGETARLAALLNHPSVVHVYELGQIDGQYYIEMEFIDGQTVDAYVKQHGRFEPGGSTRSLAGSGYAPPIHPLCTQSSNG